MIEKEDKLAQLERNKRNERKKLIEYLKEKEEKNNNLRIKVRKEELEKLEKTRKNDFDLVKENKINLTKTINSRWEKILSTQNLKLKRALNKARENERKTCISK